MSLRRWCGLGPGRRRLIVAAVAVQLALLAAALRDIARRPAEAVRGPKRLWRAVSLVDFVGPIAYFVAGRRR